MDWFNPRPIHSHISQNGWREHCRKPPPSMEMMMPSNISQYDTFLNGSVWKFLCPNLSQSMVMWIGKRWETSDSPSKLGGIKILDGASELKSWFLPGLLCSRIRGTTMWDAQQRMAAFPNPLAISEEIMHHKWKRDQTKFRHKSIINDLRIMIYNFQTSHFL